MDDMLPQPLDESLDYPQDGEDDTLDEYNWNEQ